MRRLEAARVSATSMCALVAICFFCRQHQPSHIQGEDPLDEATMKRMQAAAHSVMLQAHKSRQPRLVSCLVKIRGDLVAHVRCLRVELVARDTMRMLPLMVMKLFCSRGHGYIIRRVVQVMYPAGACRPWQFLGCASFGSVNPTHCARHGCLHEGEPVNFIGDA